MLWNMLTTLKVKINPRSAVIEWLRKVLAVVLQTLNTKDVVPNQKCPSFQLLVSLQVACLLAMNIGPPWTPFSTTNGLVASDQYWPGHPSTRKEWKLAGLNPGWTSLRMNCHLLALILDLLLLVWNNTLFLSLTIICMDFEWMVFASCSVDCVDMIYLLLQWVQEKYS